MPHVVIEPSTVLHFGVVVCRSKSRQEAELAFASAGGRRRGSAALILSVIVIDGCCDGCWSTDGLCVDGSE